MIDVEAEKEAFLAHYGVKGMKWGKRKSNSSSSSPEREARNKKVIKVATAAAVTATVIVGSVLVSKYMKNKKAMTPVSGLKQLESSEKLVSNLMSTVAGPKGTTGPQAQAHGAKIAALIGRTKDMSFDKKVTFLRNSSNPSVRDVNAKFLGDKLTEYANDPNMSFSEASKRMAGLKAMINQSMETTLM